MSTIRASNRIWRYYAVGLLWFLLLLWPMLGIHGDGSITFHNTARVWLITLAVSLACLLLYLAHRRGALKWLSAPLAAARVKGTETAAALPRSLWLTALLAATVAFPWITGRYAQDVAINVLIYICLGLGLNIVVGLAGMLDLGYIAFYGVGAYTYALLNLHYGLSFWLCLPAAALLACIAGCIIGYPTLRMRGDYLAIVTLGFGEIVRIILNNWMSLTNGPNGLLGIQPPGLTYPSWAAGLSFEHIYLKKLHWLYYVILLLSILTVVAVNRLNSSRIGRAWEAIREDETAAELMGVNTFMLKLLAYAMGAASPGRSSPPACASSVRKASPSSSRPWSCRWWCWEAWDRSPASFWARWR